MEVRLLTSLVVHDKRFLKQGDFKVAFCNGILPAATKGLRYMTIRENTVLESVKNDFIDVVHIAGCVNPSDMFTKEHKDIKHFCNLRDSVLTLLPPEITTFPVNSTQSTTYKTCDYIDSQNLSSDFIAAARMGVFSYSTVIFMNTTVFILSYEQ